MKIKKEVVVCPRCKREYTNTIVMSYSSFMFNTPPKDEIHEVCGDCGLKLVDEFEVEYYDSNGKDIRKSLKYKIRKLFNKKV